MFLNLVVVVAQILLIVNAEVVNKSEVVLVNVLFRHGERTPESFYPTDPHKENNFYPNGMGSLTNKGKRTVHRLGVFLRDEYDTLLGNFYESSKIYARSTESPRAQMSALLVLAGLWPPNPDQQWHPTLLWQPIPIHAKDYHDEDLLDSRACKYSYLFKDFYLKNHTMNEKFLKPYTEMLQYIENNSGMAVKDLISLQRFYFIVTTEHELGLPLPNWTQKVYPEPIYSAVSSIYKYFNSDLRLRQINVGYLLQKMITDFNDKIKGIDVKKTP
uniref:acid phosphatase n=1 Tax=Photinus pyralis TaxID=7054 RepID=A0A1Y1L094_PHOPY